MGHIESGQSTTINDPIVNAPSPEAQFIGEKQINEIFKDAGGELLTRYSMILPDVVQLRNPEIETRTSEDLFSAYETYAKRRQGGEILPTDEELMFYYLKPESNEAYKNLIGRGIIEAYNTGLLDLSSSEEITEPAQIGLYIRAVDQYLRIVAHDSTSKFLFREANDHRVEFSELSYWTLDKVTRAKVYLDSINALQGVNEPLDDEGFTPNDRYLYARENYPDLFNLALMREREVRVDVDVENYQIHYYDEQEQWIKERQERTASEWSRKALACLSESQDKQGKYSNKKSIGTFLASVLGVIAGRKAQTQFAPQHGHTVDARGNIVPIGAPKPQMRGKDGVPVSSAPPGEEWRTAIYDAPLQNPTKKRKAYK